MTVGTVTSLIARLLPVTLAGQVCTIKITHLVLLFCDAGWDSIAFIYTRLAGSYSSRLVRL